MTFGEQVQFAELALDAFDARIVRQGYEVLLIRQFGLFTTARHCQATKTLKKN